MSDLENLFPPLPNYDGVWQALYLEPIIGSGERITVAIAAVGEDSGFSVVQAIRPELLDCLYGNQSNNIQGMINWLIKSAKNKISKSGSLENWMPPFDGVITGPLVKAKDDDINGILKQAIRFSASLSYLSLEAEKDEGETPKANKYTEFWATSINKEVELIKPSLISFFEKSAKVYDKRHEVTYGFINQKYVANFGFFAPVMLSSSLATVKAKIVDLEILKNSNVQAKPDRFEIIIGLPDYDDPILSNKLINKLKDNMDLISEIAYQKQISVFHTDKAEDAAKHLSKVAV